ncbi:hypothetical protein HYPSUDRAFT_51216 [Hypholoma sublateritium FD-334 SS-4]|uniref:Homeobox domain-containing protein n=1 Tax=Hypholoma sublateritium (strain FD-334 SS-4) TaxID=945553 RepID=A0A0D2PIU9_HYPSF|nr:hypothetical protein HYPSUDRAFT_51216 [Hypholoma sublateritium FD-334 SS-4]
MHPAPHTQSLSRTSSSASISSEDDASMSSSTVTAIGSTRRTRKRFTNAQLTMLENLFHQNSHPSREDREAVAYAGGMEIKSVTIWFQNKRQTERKTAQAGNPDHMHSPNVVPNITSTLHTFSLHNAAHHTVSRTASPPFAGSFALTQRPSLDRVASRSELRAAAPRTPSRRPAQTAADGGPPIWDAMLSSPLAPPISPPAREFIDFGNNAKTRRTLEWACAAARVADKDGYASGMSAGFAGAASPASEGSSASAARSSSASASSKGRTIHRQRSRVYVGKERERDVAPAPRPRAPLRREDSRGSSSSGADGGGEATDEDEDEDQEAITPPSTWGKDDRRWRAGGDERAPSLTAMARATVTGVLPPKSSAAAAVAVDDDDMFKAALALCGLGGRRPQ